MSQTATHKQTNKQTNKQAAAMTALFEHDGAKPHFLTFLFFSVKSVIPPFEAW
jgi:hypothetical protein